MLFHLLFICSNLFSHLWIKCTQSTLKCDWSLTSRPSLMVTQDSSGGQGLGSFFPREQTQRETPWDAQAKPHKRSRMLFNGLLPFTVFTPLIKSRCWVQRPLESGKSNLRAGWREKHVWGVNAEQAARRLLLGMRVHLLSCCQQRPHPSGRWPTY